MAEMYLVKMKNNTFAPATDKDFQAAQKFECGEIYRGKIWKSRNTMFHRKFFALLNICFENQDRYKMLEDLRVELELRAGNYTEHITLKGEIVYIPKSISFDKMDEVEFEELYNKVIDVILKHFLKGNTREEIEKQVMMYVGF